MSSTCLYIFSVIGLASLMTLPLAESQFSLSSLLSGSTSSLLGGSTSSLFGGQLGGILSGSITSDSLLQNYLYRIPGYPRPCYNGQSYTCSCARRCPSLGSRNICPNGCTWGCHCSLGQFLGRRGGCVGVRDCILENSLYNRRTIAQRPQQSTTASTTQTLQAGATNVQVSVQPSFPTSSGCYGGRIRTRCARCDIFCSQRDNPPPCTLQCRVDCACPPNRFIDENSRCVAAEQCSSPGRSAFPVTVSTATTTTTTPSTSLQATARPASGQCPGDLIQMDCLCDRTCENRLQNARCDNAVCTPGCGCPEGYLRSEESCVFVNNCPSDVSSNSGGLTTEEPDTGSDTDVDSGPITVDNPSTQCQVECLNGGRCLRSFSGTYSCRCPYSRTGVDCSINRAANRCYPRCVAPQECRSNGLFRFRCS